MDKTTDPALLAEIEDIRDEIALKEAILESLNETSADNSDDDELKEKARKDLKRLRKHLRALQPAPKDEDDDGSPSPALDQIPEATADRRPVSRLLQTSLRSTSYRPDYLMPPKYELASRKRQRRDDFGDERPESSKSRRTTPSSGPTTAPSPADSSASLDSLDDPFLDSLFGDFSKEEVEQNQDFWERRETQKLQEESDAKLAESLAQEWAQDTNLEPTQSATQSHSDYTQSFLKTDRSANQSFGSSQKFSVDNDQPTSFVKQEPFSNIRPLTSTSVKTEPSSAYASPSLLANSIGSTSRVAVEHGPVLDSAAGYVKHELSSGPSISMPGAFPEMPSQRQSHNSVGGNSVYSSMPEDTGGIDTNGLNQYSTFLPGQQGLPSPDLAHPDSFGRLTDGYRDHAQTQAELKKLLQHIRPDEELTADQMPEQPQGLKVPLMPHQLSGLAWMKRMEEGTNKGGILADDMGLGKTLQSIALMLERPPDENKHRPTLVVAPVALMHQWKREIEKMVRSRYRMNVFILHGETRKATWSNLRAYDVILTTYGLLASELKRKLALDEKVKRLQNYQPSVAEDCPVLGDRSRFHRVILDEAHNIKNRMAKAALAACRVQADYRWALSGTPLQNNVEEAYSLVKFTRIRPYCDWDTFRRNIATPLKGRYDVPKERAMTTLQALFRAILLRRTKQSNIHGQPIIQLPPKATREDRVVFDKDQLEFYRGIESYSQIQINKYLQRGTLGRNYSHALVLLLRLRQACCHPALVIASKDFIQLPGGELDTDALLRNAQRLDVKVVERLKQLGGYECPICFDVTENPSLFFCGHAICGECLSRLVDQAANDNNGAKPSCPQCRASIDVNNVTDYTSFLRVHCPDREELQGLDVEEDDSNSISDSDSDSDNDSEDSDEGDDLRGFIVYDSDIDSESESKKPAQRLKKGRDKRKSKSKTKAKGPAKSLAQLRQEGLRSKATKRRYLKRLKKNFRPSAKTTRTIELLQEIKARGLNEKTIVFSNFTSFLDLVETQLYEHKDFRKYVRYDGSMSSVERNDAVLEFTENPNCALLLISLKAGNAGLNLTAANHVIMLDPFWNPFVEYQAADRCYRIGQTKPVTVHRLIIGQGDTETEVPSSDGGFTVEDRIMRLQEDKRRLVETALDESAGREVSRLGVRELGYLFGLNSL